MNVPISYPKIAQCQTPSYLAVTSLPHTPLRRALEVSLKLKLTHVYRLDVINIKLFPQSLPTALAGHFARLQSEVIKRKQDT